MLRRAAAAACSRCSLAAPRRGAVPPPLCRGFSLDGFSLTTPKSLDQIVKLELFERESPEQIERIWEQHMNAPGSGHIGVAVPRATYARFSDMAPKNPMFVIPVKRGDEGAYVTYLVQLQLPHAMFTLLEEYQRYGSRATPHLVLTHYTELLESKGLALARGDLTGSSSETSPADAAHLARALHRWYSEAARMAVVRQFNCSPAEFRFADVLAQCGIAPAAR